MDHDRGMRYSLRGQLLWTDDEKRVAKLSGFAWGVVVGGFLVAVGVLVS